MKKKFDLEQALAGKPVITRSGNVVKKLYFIEGVAEDVKNLVYSMLGNVITCQNNGRHYNNWSDSQFDLFMAPNKVTKWQNIFRNSCGDYYASMDLFNTELEAKEKANHSVVATVPVIFEI